MLYTHKPSTDEEVILYTCEELNKLVNNIINTNPNFVYNGSKEKGYYTIYNENTSGKKRDLSLNFRLYYPDKNSFSYDTEAKTLQSTQLNDYILSKYKDSNLLYAIIEWFSVNPTRKGMGTKVICPLVDLLKNIYTVEFILLTPKDNNAREFWTKNDFVDEGILSYTDKRIIKAARDRLIYKM